MGVYENNRCNGCQHRQNFNCARASRDLPLVLVLREISGVPRTSASYDACGSESGEKLIEVIGSDIKFGGDLELNELELLSLASTPQTARPMPDMECHNPVSRSQ